MNNLDGVLHGGAIATLFDICSACTMTVSKKPFFWFGVTRSRYLNCVYLGTAKVGEEVEIVTELMSEGKREGM